MIASFLHLVPPTGKCILVDPKLTAELKAQIERKMTQPEVIAAGHVYHGIRVTSTGEVIVVNVYTNGAPEFSEEFKAFGNSIRDGFAAKGGLFLRDEVEVTSIETTPGFDAFTALEVVDGVLVNDLAALAV